LKLVDNVAFKEVAVSIDDADLLKRLNEHFSEPPLQRVDRQRIKLECRARSRGKSQLLRRKRPDANFFNGIDEDD